MDLKLLTRKELTKLKDDIVKALKTVEARERRNARKAAEKAAAAFGFSLAEISDEKKPAAKQAGKRKKKKPAKAASKPKYRNPANPDQTWSGKGRRPRWYVEAVESGTDPDSMLI